MRLSDRNQFQTEGFTLENERIPKGLLEYPTFGIWKAFLQARPAHKVIDSSSLNDDGQDVGYVYVKDAYWVCLSCLAHIAEWFAMTPIVIGCLIRKEEAIIDYRNKIVEFKHSIMPVSIKGMGCEACSTLFNAEVLEKSNLNARRAKANVQWANLKALAMALGQPAPEGKELSILTPWLDLTTQVSDFGKAEWLKRKELESVEPTQVMKASFKVESIPSLKVTTPSKPNLCVECEDQALPKKCGVWFCPNCKTKQKVDYTRATYKLVVVHSAFRSYLHHVEYESEILES